MLSLAWELTMLGEVLGSDRSLEAVQGSIYPVFGFGDPLLKSI